MFPFREGGLLEEIRIAVRQLIEFVMRSGDIDNSYRSNQRMLEGIRAHQEIQQAYGEGYTKEVVFRNKTVLEDIEFVVEGRADGLYESGDLVIIDEIKSTTRPLEDVEADHHPLHWAQAKCYAYFYCLDMDRETIDVQLTYVNLDEEIVAKKFQQTFSRDELEAFYLDLLSRYLVFSRLIVDWREKRNESITHLRFPYPDYREGQRQMSVGIYQAIEQKAKLFIEAPTGIGKTMSAIVPAVSAIKNLGINKIYYLTAKTTTQREPERAIHLLTQNGLALKSVRITAKEKICLNDVVSCNPEDCPYAKGHFDRVNAAILDLFENENQLGFSTIQDYAEKHQVCPHEFQLDMSDYSDFVLCDYNYVFNPRVYLRRAFDNAQSDHLFLVDEAHNLVDRGREMYSAEISSRDLERLIEIFDARVEELASGSVGDVKSKIRSYRAAIKKAKKAMDLIESFYNELGSHKEIATPDHPDDLYFELKGLLTSLDFFLAKERQDPDYEEVQNLSFVYSTFTKIDETWKDGFLNLIRVDDEDHILWKIKCVDTSDLFEDILKRARSTIFFSATLSPTNFYVELLGGGDNALQMHMDSPFAEENLQIYQANLSTRYRDRRHTAEALAAYIHGFINQDEGNYMVFFPSYAYLDQIAQFYQEKYADPILVQGPSSSHRDRRKLLKEFETGTNVKGFFVLGGVFAEGIDLVGDQLVGCAVISVGMPGVSFEQNVMKSFFDTKQGNGFDYAYTYPGMTKIIQAAGRVIRSADDKGKLLLLDDRFSTYKYRQMMPRHWKKIREIASPDELGSVE